MGGCGLFFLVDFKLANEDTHFTPKYVNWKLRVHITLFQNPVHSILKDVFVGRGGDKKAKLRQKNFESAVQRALRNIAACSISKGQDSRSSLRNTLNDIDEVY